MVLFPFHTTETQRQVATHQPEDLCQVSTIQGYRILAVHFANDTRIHFLKYNLYLIFFCVCSGEDEEVVVCQESHVTQEMLEEQLVRLLTREVLDLLCKFQNVLCSK